ncbi:DUF3786 domain-containing protein [Thermodesulfobacteriota bacterium]
MPRIDDFIQARDISRKELNQKDPGLIAEYSGAEFSGDPDKDGSFSLDFLNKEIMTTWPEFDFSYKDSDNEIPIQQQVLILHYLQGSLKTRGPGVTGEWISFQDLPDGRFYLGAFIKRAKDPLLKAFGTNPKQIIDIASKAYGASPLDHGDFSVSVKALPLVPVALVLWEGDDEFPPEGNILFDKNIAELLPAEDIAWIAGMVVYPLMGMNKA